MTPSDVTITVTDVDDGTTYTDLYLSRLCQRGGEPDVGLYGGGDGRGRRHADLPPVRDRCGLFTIDPNTGVVSFIEAPDFEDAGDVGGDNVYNITVTASDGAMRWAAMSPSR